MAFIFLVSIGRIQEFIPGIQGMRLGNVSFGLAFLVLFFQTSRNTPSLIAPPQVKCLLLLYLLGWVSMPFGIWPGGSLKLLTSGFLTGVLSVFLIIKLLDTSADLFRAAWGLALSLGLLGFVMVASYVGGRGAVAGISYDANDLAFTMVTFLPLVYFMVKQSRGWRCVLLTGITMSAIWTIVLTQSRGGFIGLLTVVACLLIHERVGLKKAVAVGALLLLIILYMAPPEYSKRMGTIISPSQDFNITATSGRLEVWKRGLKIMADNPLLGVGPGSFAIAEGASHAEHGGKWSVAHNSLLQIGAETGFPGLFLFLAMIYYSHRTTRDIRLRQKAGTLISHLASGVEIGLYGYLVNAFFLSQAYSGALLVLVGFSAAIASLADQSDAARQIGQVADSDNMSKLGTHHTRLR
jgi:O-antigen ligase